MKRVYISSTYADLKDYRSAVADALRRCDYDVDAMEKYAARDDRPKEACEKDVSKCDLYLGLIAWRYGFIPPDDNPERKSITELEYLAAGRTEKPRLVFLLADGVDWPPALRDTEAGNEGRRVREFRDRLKDEKWVSFFNSPDELVKQALVSIFQLEATKQVETVAALEQVQSAREIQSSHMSHITGMLQRSTGFVAVDVGETIWWNTRLHLAAALASDFTDVRQLVLLENARFQAMASPAELRRALTNAEPRLEIAYLKAREGRGDLFSTTDRYKDAVTEVFKCSEAESKQDLNAAAIRNLGIRHEAEVVDASAGQNRPELYAEIIRRRLPYVVLMREGTLEGVVDRVQLSSALANAFWRA